MRSKKISLLFLCISFFGDWVLTQKATQLVCDQQFLLWTEATDHRAHWSCYKAKWCGFSLAQPSQGKCCLVWLFFRVRETRFLTPYITWKSHLLSRGKEPLLQNCMTVLVHSWSMLPPPLLPPLCLGWVRKTSRLSCIWPFWCCYHSTAKYFVICTTENFEMQVFLALFLLLCVKSHGLSVGMTSLT